MGSRAITVISPRRYTLFYEHTLDGTPVTRPLFQEYPKEEETFTIDDQYLLGEFLQRSPYKVAKSKLMGLYSFSYNTVRIWWYVLQFKNDYINNLSICSSLYHLGYKFFTHFKSWKLVYFIQSNVNVVFFISALLLITWYFYFHLN